jgi:hypothetical protein
MSNSELIIYTTEDGKTRLETRLEDETVWLSIEQMATLFQKSRSTINEHILNIYEEQELDSQSSMRKIGISDFSTKPTLFYNAEKHFIEQIENESKKLKPKQKKQ